MSYFHESCCSERGVTSVSYYTERSYYPGRKGVSTLGERISYFPEKELLLRERSYYPKGVTTLRERRSIGITTLMERKSYCSEKGVTTLRERRSIGITTLMERKSYCPDRGVTTLKDKELLLREGG